MTASAGLAIGAVLQCSSTQTWRALVLARLVGGAIVGNREDSVAPLQFVLGKNPETIEAAAAITSDKSWPP
jgi:hypothetical protein